MPKKPKTPAGEARTPPPTTPEQDYLRAHGDQMFRRGRGAHWGFPGAGVLGTSKFVFGARAWKMPNLKKKAKKWKDKKEKP